MTQRKVEDRDPDGNLVNDILNKIAKAVGLGSSESKPEEAAVQEEMTRNDSAIEADDGAAEPRGEAPS